jgi:hypothetical protein
MDEWRQAGKALGDGNQIFFNLFRNCLYVNILLKSLRLFFTDGLWMNLMENEEQGRHDAYFSIFKCSSSHFYSLLYVIQLFGFVVEVNFYWIILK